ncbi:CU044_5270 family protein [Nonomuraea sp. NEAU-A123]|uniref:CU044_5270 family protein n=1 Tax=Nonomuraea sp. NEAU-A123 TaxID=2839649 RepID=UPI001BE4B9E5|nr:CU044_5270 family protein [Nonomuraea sp. NEAU-A123]MBT2229223.1 CU044_5270 family protein [Nonomuraea sp. NEAU-A123]
MNDHSDADLDALRRAWPEPAPPSHETCSAARAALLQEVTAAVPRRARRFRLPRAAGRVLAVGVLAAAITVVPLVVENVVVDAPRPIVPGLAMPAANAQVLLHKAAAAARDRPFTAPRPDQWIYMETRHQGVGNPAPGQVQTPETPRKPTVDRSWTRADGKVLVTFEGGKMVRSPTGGGMPPTSFAKVAALPTDPDALLTWLYGNMGDHGEKRDVIAYRMLGSLLGNNLVPPAQEAAVYQAMAKIPGVTVNPDAVDVAGRPALAVGSIEDGWVGHEILLDRTTYTYLGERAVAIADFSYITQDTFYAIKKGTIMTLAVRLATGITDKPGVRP